MIAPLAVSDAIADLLATPDAAAVPRHTTAEHRQQLAYGPLGIALLHIERAASGRGPWQRVHDWMAAATAQPLTTGPDSHPFYGAPALAHAVACAAEHLPGPYQRALDKLDTQMTADVTRRIDAAHRRLDAQLLPTLAEFDCIRGLAGHGSHLLRRDPGSPAMRAVLEYCVRLTEPLTDQRENLPGWWTAGSPSGRPHPDFPLGHGNLGVAHGIGGVLAVLALAARKGALVAGHHDALRTILAWLDHWQDPSGQGTVWPYWVTRAELRTDRLAPSSPRRPSWCYGTAGLARAQQLAALVLGDTSRQSTAEETLACALHDPAQIEATTDHGLCHGFAGLAHVAARTAHDAHPQTAERLRTVLPVLLTGVCRPDAVPAEAARALLQDEEAGPGFLNGASGAALGLMSAATAPHSAWDACLLTS
ncbi:lanthionine synthetase C family protein [Streptomyces sp. NPDC004111]|uniref:lanthionine synthetase C family protein n=1 Tax=Streptomyces sp. NPDC004111 TaxID=3364690 RepID=UPI0036A4CE8C